MQTLTKADIIRQVWDNGLKDMTQDMAKDAVNWAFYIMERSLSAGNKISIPGFGVFKIRESARRNARNPRTGDLIIVEAGAHVKFTPAKALKDECQAEFVKRNKNSKK